MEKRREATVDNMSVRATENSMPPPLGNAQHMLAYQSY